jgi:hypothetical protein
MMALLPTIVFVTTDIFMVNVIKMLLSLRIFGDNKHFSKNSVFSQFHLTKQMTFMSNLRNCTAKIRIK